MNKIVVSALLLAMVSSLQSTPSFRRYFVGDVCRYVKPKIVTRWILAARLQDDQNVMVENKKALLSLLSVVARRNAMVQLLVDCTGEHVQDLQKLQAAGVQVRLYPWTMKAAHKTCSTPRDIEMFSLVQTVTASKESFKAFNKPTHVSMQTLFYQNDIAHSHSLHNSLYLDDRSYNGLPDDLSKPNKMSKEFERNWKKGKDL
jgi:hypothetical protein